MLGIAPQARDSTSQHQRVKAKHHRDAHTHPEAHTHRNHCTLRPTATYLRQKPPPPASSKGSRA